MIFRIPRPELWVVLARSGDSTGEMVVFAFAADKHHDGLRPLETVLAVELVVGDGGRC